MDKGFLSRFNMHRQELRKAAIRLDEASRYLEFPKYLLRTDTVDVPNAPTINSISERYLSFWLRLAKKKAFAPNGQMWDSAKHGNDVEKYVRYRHAFSIMFTHIVYKETLDHKAQCNGGYDFGDVFNTGFYALLKAVDGHNFNKKNRFYTFAKTAVRNEIHKGLDRNSRSIRVPSHRVTQFYLYRRRAAVRGDWTASQREFLIKKDFKIVDNTLAMSEFTYDRCHLMVTREYTDKRETDTHIIMRKVVVGEGTYGITPTGPRIELLTNANNAAMEKGLQSVIDNSTGLNRADLASIVNPTVSIDTPLGDDGEITYGDIISKEESCQCHYKRELLNKALSLINDRSALVLRQYYYQRRGFASIGKDLGISKQRVKQIRDKALRNLQNNDECMRLLSLANSTGDKHDQ